MGVLPDVEYPNIQLSTTLGFLHVNGGAVLFNGNSYITPGELQEGRCYLLNVETGVMVECDPCGVPLEEKKCNPAARSE